jgi:hypothetical protein
MTVTSGTLTLIIRPVLISGTEPVLKLETNVPSEKQYKTNKNPSNTKHTAYRSLPTTCFGFHPSHNRNLQDLQ